MPHSKEMLRLKMRGIVKHEDAEDGDGSEDQDSMNLRSVAMAALTKHHSIPVRDLKLPNSNSQRLQRPS